MVVTTERAQINTDDEKMQIHSVFFRDVPW